MGMGIERQECFDMIGLLRPAWLVARNAARRDDYQNANLNLYVKTCFAPIDRLLDTVIKLDLLEQADHAEAQPV